MPESNDTPDGWAEAAAAKQSEALQGLRLQIDAVDRELLALLNRRASLSLEVGRVKANTSGPVFRPQRERQILDNLARENAGPLPEEHLRSIWHEIFASSRSLQRPVSVKTVGLGHRVCVDTLTLMERGQGMLVGNSSAFTFLVHAETEHNEYVAARPFRINAGGVHAYAMMPGDKTCYVGELRSGDEVLIVDKDGRTSLATIGRIKTEVRPMLMITAQMETPEGTRTGSVFLQNAETIRLVRPDGTPVSVVALRPGDEVICRSDVAGRHFGMRIQENIREI